MSAMDDPRQLRHGRREYVRNMEAHPPSTWPSGLFRAVNAVIELHFGHPDLGNGGKPKLSVVRDTVQA